jgi:glycosyltransferase involved in cell wall biosynthesis
MAGCSTPCSLSVASCSAPSSILYLLDTHPRPSETFIQREIDALRRRGWAIDVASLRGAAALPARGTAADFAALAPAMLRHALPVIGREPGLLPRLLRHLPQAAALAGRARASGARLLHAHFAWLPADLALLVARRLGIPFTCSVHAWDVFAQPPSATRRRLLPAVAAVACSQAAADVVHRSGIPSGRVHLVRHGLPLAEFPFVPAAADGRLLAVGRLEAKKGFDLLPALCAHLRAAGAAHTCHIVGEGPERPRIARLAARCGVADAVTFAGALPPAAVRDAMRAASVLLLPSRRMPDGDRDGVANVLVEAMALGLPVATTTAGAAGELVRDGANGRLVPPGDPAALAAAVAPLLHDPAARARLAAAGRATVEAEYDEDRNVEQLARAFRESVGQGRTAAV